MFSQVSLTEFAIGLRDQFDKHKSISAVDMEILANKLNEIDPDEADFMEDIMRKFRKCRGANPVPDAIVYVIVRNYLDHNMADLLLPLLKDRSYTGILPDPCAFSLLMDHFIEEKKYASAAQVAYELMLQEDFSHPTSRYLALHSCVHYLQETSLDDIAPVEIKDPEGEEEWIPVKYIRYPSYDDHFDIKAEQYLLGKTLYFLGKECGEQDSLALSLQVVGLGLYHKFARCLLLLKNISESGDKSVVKEVFTYVEESLEKTQVRDPKKPEKETGMLTIDDEIYKLLPTQEEKDGFHSQLQQLKQTLSTKGKAVDEKLSTLADNLVKSELPKHEAADIETQTRCLAEWREERQKLLAEQMYEMEKQQKISDIETKLKELQEKEELIRFFELQDRILLSQYKIPPKELTPEEEEIQRMKIIKGRKYRGKI